MVGRIKQAWNSFMSRVWRKTGKQQSTGPGRGVPATQGVNPYGYCQPPPNAKPKRGIFWRIPIGGAVGKTFRIDKTMVYVGPPSDISKFPLETRLRDLLARISAGTGSDAVRRVKNGLLDESGSQISLDGLRRVGLEKVWQDVGLALHTAPVETYNEFMSELDMILTEIAKSRRLK